MPRFLFVRAETESPPLFTEEVFEAEHQKALIDLSDKLLGLDFDNHGEPTIYELSTEAKTEYISWHNRQASEQWYSVEGGLDKSCLSKLRGHCLRLCLILHILEMDEQELYSNKPVSAETMRRAIELADWFKMQQKQVMQLWKDSNVTEINPLEKRIMEAIISLEGEIEKGVISISRITTTVNIGIEEALKFSSRCSAQVLHEAGLGLPKDAG